MSVWLSIVSLVIAVASFTYAFGWRARPLLRVEYSEVENNDDSLGNPYWTLWLANRGNGPAYDIRVNVTPDDGLGQVPSFAVIEPGQRCELNLMVTPFVPIGSEGAGAWRPDKVDPATISAVLRWRALPFLRVYRRKTIRPGGKWENLVWFEANGD